MCAVRQKALYISAMRDGHPEHIKNSYHSVIKRQHRKNEAKGRNKQYSKKDMQTVNKHTRSYSTSLVITNMPVQKAQHKPPSTCTSTSWWGGGGGSAAQGPREAPRSRHFDQRSGCFPKWWTYLRSSNSTPGYRAKRNGNAQPQKSLYTAVCSNMAQNSQNAETSPMLDRCLDK